MQRRETILLLLLASCAAGETRHHDAGPMSTPNATDVSNAMAYSMPPLEEGGWFCAIVDDIQCSPTGSTGRLQCSFKYQGKRRMAVLERTGRTEWERSGQWRLVRGWKSCGWLY